MIKIKHFTTFLLSLSLLCSCDNSKLHADKTLKPNQSLVSDNRRYKLALQEDGNLVLYKGGNEVAWSSETFGQGVTQCKMEKDGNFVLYTDKNIPKWNSETYGHEGAYLFLSDSGILEIHKDGKKIWDPISKPISNSTADDKSLMLPKQILQKSEYLISSNKEYSLKLQADGNLVLYKKITEPIWNSNTSGLPVEYCEFQEDGNLVLYGGNHKPYWSSQTYNVTNPRLKLHNNGVLVITNGVNIIWASNNK